MEWVFLVINPSHPNLRPCTTEHTTNNITAMHIYGCRGPLKRKHLKWIQKTKKPAYMYVDPVTLQPLSAQARDVVGARAHRQPQRKERITVRNLSQVTTLVLLRMRARTVQATYKRHWEYIANIKPRKFQ